MEKDERGAAEAEPKATPKRPRRIEPEAVRAPEPTGNDREDDMDVEEEETLMPTNAADGVRVEDSQRGRGTRGLGRPGW